MGREVIISKGEKIHCIGSDHPNGSYLLRINLEKPVEIRFGRFKRGKKIYLKKGEYVYIGSALAIRGSTTLGNRLRRHTSRSSDSLSHNIQTSLLEFFDEIDISYTKNPSPKKMFWNIDHLLNLTFAEIAGIIFVREPKPLENVWSEYLEDSPETYTFEKGLGANDSMGQSHLQFSNITDNQWKGLPYKLPL